MYIPETLLLEQNVYRIERTVLRKALFFLWKTVRGNLGHYRITKIEKQLNACRAKELKKALMSQSGANTET